MLGGRVEPAPFDVNPLAKEHPPMARARKQPADRDRIDQALEDWARELPELDQSIEGIVERIQSLAKYIRRSMDETASETGLSFGDWGVLGMLRRPGPPYRRTPGQLARWMSLSGPAMTNRLDRLEEAGLVRRLPDPEDRRAIQVELTDKGHQAWEESVGMQAAKEELITSAALDEKEREQLNDLLRRLTLAFERSGIKPAPKEPAE
jgi:DNA-binding MarR family transcriptional regulator